MLWTSILSRDSRNTPSRFILQKPGYKLIRPDESLGFYADVTITFHSINIHEKIHTPPNNWNIAKKVVCIRVRPELIPVSAA